MPRFLSFAKGGGGADEENTRSFSASSSAIVSNDSEDYLPSRRASDALIPPHVGIRRRVSNNYDVTELGEMISREISRYGGDDIHDPAPKPRTTSGHRRSVSGGLERVAVSMSRTPAPDPNHVVDWDGPDDPQNPQNWSRSYKWLLTAICMLLCLNV